MQWPILAKASIILGLLSSTTNAITGVDCATAKWDCPANTVQKTAYAGERDGSTNFWAAIDTCWYSPYELQLRLKVVSTEGDLVLGRYVLQGAGVDSPSDELWASEAGENVCSTRLGQRFKHSFSPDSKRTLGVKVQGEGRTKLSTTMKNPCIYGTAAEKKLCG